MLKQENEDKWITISILRSLKEDFEKLNTSGRFSSFSDFSGEAIRQYFKELKN